MPACVALATPPHASAGQPVDIFGKAFEQPVGGGAIASLHVARPLVERVGLLGERLPAFVAIGGILVDDASQQECSHLVPPRVVPADLTLVQNRSDELIIGMPQRLPFGGVALVDDIVIRLGEDPMRDERSTPESPP
jgi:hypothetical protein